MARQIEMSHMDMELLSPSNATTTNKIEMSSEKKCGGLCASKKVVIEGLYITTNQESCCAKTQNVIPMAAVDDITLVEPTKCQYFFKTLMCCSTVRNGKCVLCECSCDDTIILIDWAVNKQICIESINDPQEVFEQMKQRLHVAKGGPVAAPVHQMMS